MSGFKIKKIQKIETVDGNMIPIYRDWDHEINLYHQPKMVYATTLKPGVTKDIILHERRSAYMTCIQGSVKIELLVNNCLEEVVLDYENSKNEINLLLISPGIPIKIHNMSDDLSIIINCPDPAWHADDPDTIKFKNWSDISQ